MHHAPLPQRTVRAIDRLARGAHAFHRFAHHPLCERYAGELIPLGRRARVCRGCAAAALGSLLGLLAALLVRPSFPALLGASALGVALLLSSLALRLPKWLGRAGAAACLGFACLGGVLSARGAPLVLALGVLLSSAAFLALYRKRGPNRAPCQHCPERLGPRTCSGLRPIVRRERAFRRLSQRWLDAAIVRGQC
ncbi:MAG TPA: hypothetical protein VGJ91_13470 [Polyangiaceae bacterium]|jgi:hypothetical protein